MLDENKIIDGLSINSVQKVLDKHFTCNKYSGWYFQQFLKMGFALTKYAKDDYLIWDADTIPLKNLLFFKDGKYYFTIKTEYHKPYFDTLENLIGVGKIKSYSFIAEHMPINVNIMKELIAHIENLNCNGKNWFEKIIYSTSGSDEQAFSEFETYGTYCSIKYNDIFVPNILKTLREAGKLYGRYILEKDFNDLKKSNYDTASFELRDIPKYPRKILYWYERVVVSILRRLKIIK